MEVRHNTSLLEKALEHVVRQASIPSIEAEASAQEKMARAQGFRRMATGAALGIAAVGIGLGIWLAYPLASGSKTSWLPTDATKILDRIIPGSNKTSLETSTDPATVELPKTDSPTVLEPAPDIPAIPDVVTTNYTIFNSRTISLAGRPWELTAGHFFENETDKQWKHAWCYTEDRRDGLIIKIDLVSRDSQVARPMAPVASVQTLQKSGLSTLEALTLAARCPWLDEKIFTVRDFNSVPGQQNPFEPDETTYKLVGATLVVGGSIGVDFLDRIKSYTFDTLDLNSPGGVVDVAVEAGRWLRMNGKAVRVSSSCLSACVFVLAGGTTREADPTAHIGVHRFYNVGPQAAPDEEAAQELSSKILRHLQDMGVDVELFHVMANTPSTEMFYIDRSKLASWRLLTPLEVGTPEAGRTDDPKAARERFLMSSSSVWVYGNSIVGLTKEGSKRTLRFLQTDPSLSKSVIARGSILFDGTTPNGRDYQGTAYAHHECGIRAVEVAGSLAEDGSSMILRGQANGQSPACASTDTTDVQIQLDFIGLTTSSDLFVKLKARGFSLPAELRDPDPKPLVEIEGFELLEQSDLPGGDFDTVKGISLTQCAKNCSDMSRCKGFTYNRKAQWCFLKGTIGPLISMQDAIAGKKLR